MRGGRSSHSRMRCVIRWRSSVFSRCSPAVGSAGMMFIVLSEVHIYLHLPAAESILGRQRSPPKGGGGMQSMQRW